MIAPIPNTSTPNTLPDFPLHNRKSAIAKLGLVSPTAHQPISPSPKRGRPKAENSKTNAQRQAEHRAQTELLRRALADFRVAFESACDLAGSPQLADDCPDEPTAWLIEMTKRLENKALVGFKRKPQ